jgi:hypothetical protein
MVWDPLGSIGRAFWIGGGQWAGKTTVARTIAERHRLVVYRHDFPAAHGHIDRAAAAEARAGKAITEFDPEWEFVQQAPEQMAAGVFAQFTERFDWALDDLRALDGPVPIVAEGWGLRPELVAGIGCADRMVVMVATEEFRQHQLATLPRAGKLGNNVSDPERGHRNRVERDRLVAEDAVKSAVAQGIAVVEVDGSRDAGQIADVVAKHFGLD